MKIENLTPAGYNPRKISDEQLERLKKALYEFGDLSGIIYNRRTGNLVGGHQRLKCLPPDAVIEKKDIKEKTRTGTIAHGHIIIDGERYTYREVDWDESREKAANIAAEKTGRACFGLEMDNHYCDVIIKRCEDFTGKQAVK